MTEWKKLQEEIFLDEILKTLYIYSLENESWAQIHLINNLNDLYKLFLSKFMYYLASAFPIMTYYKKKG